MQLRANPTLAYFFLSFCSLNSWSPTGVAIWSYLEWSTTEQGSSPIEIETKKIQEFIFVHILPIHNCGIKSLQSRSEGTIDEIDKCWQINWSHSNSGVVHDVSSGRSLHEELQTSASWSQSRVFTNDICWLCGRRLQGYSSFLYLSIHARTLSYSSCGSSTRGTWKKNNIWVLSHTIWGRHWISRNFVSFCCDANQSTLLVETVGFMTGPLPIQFSH